MPIPSQATMKVVEGVTTRDDSLTLGLFRSTLKSFMGSRASRWLYKADIEHLRYLYDIKKFSCYEIAEIFDCGGTTVKNYLPSVGIPLRPLGAGQGEALARFSGSPKHLESIRESSVQTIVNFNKSERGRDHIHNHVRQLNKAKISHAQKILVVRLRNLGWEIPDNCVNFEIIKGNSKFHEFQYFLDIADPEVLMCVEVDGWTHDNPGKLEADKIRDNTLHSLGWSVLRFTDDEVFNDTGDVLSKILELRQSLHERRAQLYHILDEYKDLEPELVEDLIEARKQDIAIRGMIRY